MAYNDQPAAQAIPKTLAAKREDSAPRSGLLPRVGVLAAAAFVANAWFFYHQGQRDGANQDNGSAPISAPAAPSDEAGSPSTAKALPAETALVSTDTAQPAAEGQTASRSAVDPDMVFVVKPAAHGKARPVDQLMAKTAKPGRETLHGQSERQVALIAHPNPTYPTQALRTGEQGTVYVLAQVDVAGNVSDARVVRHSGSTTLDRAAANEVRRWKFEPALHDGRPAVASVEVPVSYRLGQ